MSSSWNISGLGIIDVVNDIDRCHTSTRGKTYQAMFGVSFPSIHHVKPTMWWFELAQNKYGLQNEHDIGSSSIDAELCNGHLLASFLRIPKLNHRDTKTKCKYIEQKVIQGVVVGQKSSNNIGNKWKTVRFWNASGTWERTVIQTSWNGESPTSAFRTHMTFHYTDWLIGIITMAYGNPYIKLGRCNPPKTQQITRVNWSLLTWISATTLWEALSWPNFFWLWLKHSLKLTGFPPGYIRLFKTQQGHESSSSNQGLELLGFHWLVVGFNPSEHYDRQTGSFPPLPGWKLKTIWNHHHFFWKGMEGYQFDRTPRRSNSHQQDDDNLAMIGSGNSRPKKKNIILSHARATHPGWKGVRLKQPSHHWGMVSITYGWST